jgi:hypothetical protein
MRDDPPTAASVSITSSADWAASAVRVLRVLRLGWVLVISLVTSVDAAVVW